MIRPDIKADPRIPIPGFPGPTGRGPDPVPLTPRLPLASEPREALIRTTRITRDPKEGSENELKHARTGNRPVPGVPEAYD